MGRQEQNEGSDRWSEIGVLLGEGGGCLVVDLGRHCEFV